MQLLIQLLSLKSLSNKQKNILIIQARNEKIRKTSTPYRNFYQYLKKKIHFFRKNQEKTITNNNTKNDHEQKTIKNPNYEKIKTKHKINQNLIFTNRKTR